MCGISSQYKLQLDRSRKVADMLTQDLSYAMSSPYASVNSRIQMEDYVEPMVSTTVQDAASHLAAMLWHHLKQSPFHIEGGMRLLPPSIHPLAISSLQVNQSLDTVGESQKYKTPLTLRQRAITTKLAPSETLSVLLQRSVSHHSSLHPRSRYYLWGLFLCHALL
jgi:hypothetical protein